MQPNSTDYRPSAPAQNIHLFLSGLTEEETEIVERLFTEAAVNAHAPGMVVHRVREKARQIIAEHEPDFFPRTVAEKLLSRTEERLLDARGYANSILGGADR